MLAESGLVGKRPKSKYGEVYRVVITGLGPVIRVFRVHVGWRKAWIRGPSPRRTANGDECALTPKAPP